MMPRTSPVPTGRPSFLAASRCADLDLLDADVAVLGVPYTTPCDLVASRGPSSDAPDAVREQSLSMAGRLTHYDFDFGGDLFAGRHVRIVDCGDGLVTPPIDCGLLPGTFRAHLIATGRIREGVVTGEAPRRARRVFLMNSVRLWREAVLAG